MANYRDIEPLANLKVGRAIDRLAKENAARMVKINADFAARGLSQSGPLDGARLSSLRQMAEEICREVCSIWLELIVKGDQVLTQEATTFVISKVEEYANGLSRHSIQSSMTPTPEGVAA